MIAEIEERKAIFADKFFVNLTEEGAAAIKGGICQPLVVLDTAELGSDLFYYCLDLIDGQVHRVHFQHIRFDLETMVDNARKVARARAQMAGQGIQV
jgi:hypothetical protein